jgi:hypothetical protein
MVEDMTVQPSDEVLVVGMSRSGTTVVADILSAADNVHIEMEPHLIWKAGDFVNAGDGDHLRDDSAYSWIRGRLIEQSAGRILVEKSPPNSLRPETVHRVFPDARILYVQRDPYACLYSNYVKSCNQQAFSPRIALRKYLLVSREDQQTDITFGSDRQATGGRPLWRQLRRRDTKSFVEYSSRLWHIRRHEGTLPFGPKLDGFEEIVRDVGLLGYHAQCLMKAAEKALIFRELYGANMHVVTLEELSSAPDRVVKDILEFVKSEIAAGQFAHVVDGISSRKAAQSLPTDFTGRLASVAPDEWAAQMDAHAKAIL